MEKPAEFQMQSATDRPTAILSGDWTTNLLDGVGAELARELRGHSDVTLDLTQVRRMDTAGAFAVIRAVGPDFSLDQVEARPESKRLLELVDNAVRVKPIERPQ